MYWYSYILLGGIRVTHKRYLCQPLLSKGYVNNERFIDICISVIMGGNPITENRLYEKKRRTRGTIRMYAFMHIKN